MATNYNDLPAEEKAVVESEALTAVVNGVGGDQAVVTAILDNLQQKSAQTGEATKTVIGTGLGDISQGDDLVFLELNTAQKIDLSVLPKDTLQGMNALVLSTDQATEVVVPKSFSGQIVLGSGNDTLVFKGNQTKPQDISLGQGNDSVTTKNGADTVSGGAGSDTIKTGSGSDVVKAGFGDSINAGAGKDTISLGANTDEAPSKTTIDGGSGQDSLRLEDVVIKNVAKGKNGATIITLDDGTELTVKNIEKFTFDMNGDGAISNDETDITLVGFINHDFGS